MANEELLQRLMEDGVGDSTENLPVWAPAPKQEAAPVAPAAPAAPEQEKPWYSRFLDWTTEAVTGNERQAAMTAKGYSTEEAPWDVQARASLPTGVKEQMLAGAKALEERTGKKVSFKSHPEYGAMFQLEGEDKWRPWNAPGASPGDIFGLGGEAFAMGGDIGGLMTGAGATRKGSSKTKAVGALFGSMIGAGLGETTRQNLAESRGDYEGLTKEELSTKGWEAPKAAAMSAAGIGAAKGLQTTYRLGKGTAQAILNKVGPEGISEVVGSPGYLPEMFAERGSLLGEALSGTGGTTQARVNVGVIDEVNRYMQMHGIPGQFKPNAAQVSRDPVFAAALNRIASDPSAKGFETLQAYQLKNEGALKELSSRLMMTDNGTRAGFSLQDQLDTGRMLTGLFGDKKQTELFRLEDGLDEAMTYAETHANNISDLAADAPHLMDLGSSVRSIIGDVVDKVSESSARAYAPIIQLSKGAKFSVSNLAKVIEEEQARHGGSFAPDFFSPNTGKLLNAAEDSATVLRTTPTGGEYKAPEFMTFEGIADTISKLEQQRSAILLKGAGAPQDINVKTIDRMLEAVKKDRDIRMSSFTPEMREMVKQADAVAASQKSRLGGVVHLLTKGGAKGFNVSDQAVFSKIFGSSAEAATNARQLSGILMDSGRVDTLDQIKSSIFREFYSKTAPGGKVSPARATSWIKNNQSALEAYMSPSEIAILKNSTSMGEAAAVMKAQKKELQRRFATTLEHQIFDGMTPDQIFKEIYADPLRVQALKNSLEKDFPQEWESFKRLAQREVFDEANSARDMYNSRDLLNVAALNNMLTTKTSQKLEALFGPKYVKNLEMLRDASEMLLNGKLPTEGGVAQNYMVNTLRLALFGPLSHSGAVLNSAKTAMYEKGWDSAAAAILDPDVLAALSKKSLTPPDIKMLRNVFGATVMDRLIKDSSGFGAGDLQSKEGSVHKAVNDLSGLVSSNPALNAKVRSAIANPM